MRKWMRDKFKRRKKTQEEPAAAKPAPLQPAYFSSEAEAVKPAPSETSPEVGPAEVVREPHTPEPLVEAEDGAGPESGVTSGSQPGDANRRPRRRRRGGRGRRRPAQPVPSTTSPGPAEQKPVPAPAAAAVAVRAAEPPRATKGVVVLAIGLPGSGKSSWFKRHNITPLSSDMLRSLLFDDPAEQGFQDLVFSNLRSMLKARLLARRPLNYVDATNLTPHDRHSWIKLAKDFGYEVQAVFFDVPLEVCLERNHRRQRVVTDDVMRQMSAKLKAPTFEEGFSKITVVRVKQKE
jgi:predicted kinase